LYAHEYERLIAAASPAPVRLTPEEKKLYGQLFRIADSEQLGVITGTVAVEFFKKSKLTPNVLAEVSRIQRD
jgi:epidermal growth factor receptor substrate 15